MSEDLEKLRRKRQSAYKNLVKIASMMKGYKETFDELVKQHAEAVKEWRDLDYKISLRDGRRKLIEPGMTGKKAARLAAEVNEDDLTEAQVRRLLARFKIEVPEVELPEEEEVSTEKSDDTDD